MNPKDVPVAKSGITAPTPQNTPLTSAPIAHGLSRPTVPDISEDIEEDDGDDDDDDDDDEEGGVGGGGTAGKSSGYIESLPVEVKRTVEGLKGVQSDYEKIQMEYKKEMYLLEMKYHAKYQPLFDRRADLINAKAKPTAAEVTLGEQQSAKDNEEYVPLPAATKTEENAAPAGVPEFWLTALRNHLGINELITDRDEAALKYLTDISISYAEPAPGTQTSFTLTFHFAPNPFFSNEKLTKTYLYKEEVGFGGDFLYDRAVGDTIKWKEDKDLTKEIEIKKQRNKNTNRTRVIRKSVPTDSFFNFFSPPVPPPEDAMDDEDEDDDEFADLSERLELDYQIGEDIKERVVPRAVDYFTGKALEYDSLDDLDDDEDIESDDSFNSD